MIKKIIFMFVLAIPMGLTPAVVAGATSNSKPTTIGGVVTDNNKPVPNRAVSLACSSGGHAKFIGSGHTDASGRYATRIKAGLCPSGSHLIARVDKNGNGKFEPNEIGIGQIIINGGTNIINIVINIHKTPVPEFGPVAAAVAAVTAVGGLLLVRRRILSFESQPAVS